jgi:hypothetical protein
LMLLPFKKVFHLGKILRLPQGLKSPFITISKFASLICFQLADIIISELLGSFGDNELSPECLYSAQHLVILAECHSEIVRHGGFMSYNFRYILNNIHRFQK